MPYAICPSAGGEVSGGGERSWRRFPESKARSSRASSEPPPAADGVPIAGFRAAAALS